MATDTEGLKKEIEEQKSILEDKYAIAQVAARKLIEKHRDLLIAEEERDIKNSSRAIARHELAENAFNVAIKEYFMFLNAYDAMVEKVASLYSDLVAVECAKGAKKARAEAEKFEMHERYRKDKLIDTIRDVSNIIDAYIADDENNIEVSEVSENVRKSGNEPSFEGNGEDMRASVRESAEKTQNTNDKAQSTYQYQPPQSAYSQPQYVPYDIYRPYPPQGVSVAPVSIDISGIVEDAVAAAMNKFKAVFEDRAEEYLTNKLQKNISGNSNSPAAEIISDMQAEIAECELDMASKLSELIDNLKSLSNDIINLGASYMQLANTQKDVAEAQKKTNDIQRSLVRDMQGVQANQKVILQEQGAVSLGQVELIERQKINAENQAMLSAAEAEILEIHKSIQEAQGTVTEAAREILASQKNIISMQQSIIGAQNKTTELQRELTARQSEATSIQKSIMSEHKQLMKKLEKNQT